MLKVNLETSIDNINYIHFMEQHQEHEKNDNEKRIELLDAQNTRNNV